MELSRNGYPQSATQSPPSAPVPDALSALHADATQHQQRVPLSSALQRVIFRGFTRNLVCFSLAESYRCVFLLSSLSLICFHLLPLFHSLSKLSLSLSQTTSLSLSKRPLSRRSPSPELSLFLSLSLSFFLSLSSLKITFLSQ